MAEYIDRDHYCKYICRCNGDKCEKTKCPIFTAPTADVASVVHGEWKIEWDAEKDPKKYFIRIVCSHCGLKTGQKSNYCPMCGADMRKKVE